MMIILLLLFFLLYNILVEICALTNFRNVRKYVSKIKRKNYAELLVSEIEMALNDVPSERVKMKFYFKHFPSFGSLNRMLIQTFW